MAAPFIFETQIRRVEKVEQQLAAADIDAARALAAMQVIVEELKQAKLDVIMHLRIRSSVDSFESLELFITKTRNVLYRMIQDVGQMDRDIHVLKDAGSLLDAIASYIELKNNVEALKQRKRTISGDQRELQPSIVSIQGHLDKYKQTVELLHEEYRRRLA